MPNEMERMRTQIVRYSILLGTLTCLAATVPAAEIINNGGFESGFTGWVRMDALGSDGSFFLQTGTSSPVNATAVPAPPGAVRSAMTDAQGPGTHVLYQDFVLNAPVGSAVLSFDDFVGNRAGGFFVPNPATLDFGVAAFNQQARVDILLGSAAAFSVSSADVLLSVFQTNSGDPAVSGYTFQSAQIASILNAHLNTPLRLRFAEVDNVAAFQFGVDNVSILTSSVPEPATFLTGSLGTLLGLLLVRRRSR
jgi:hypothetical protein